MYEDVKTCCIYARYSSNNQTEQSIEGQLSVCEEFCKRNGITIVKTYIDRATSAAHDIQKRVNFLEMISDSAKHKWDAVVVYKLDRFSRSRYDMANYKYKLKKNGVQLISATENITNTPEGIILESVLEGMAEFYSAELSQKIKRGMNESVKKHNSTGGVTPLGYKTVNKKLVKDEETSKWVQEAFQMYADGHTVSEICNLFNAKGRKTVKGANFGRTSFSKMFRNPKYVGDYTYRGETVAHDEKSVEPIISKDLWDAVQSKLRTVKHSPASSKATEPYLLTHKLFCGHCGSSMHGIGGTSKHKYYACWGKVNATHPCTKKNVPKNWIEDVVVNDAVQFLTDDTIEKIAEIAIQENNKVITETTDLTEYQSRLVEITKSLQNLTKAIETGEAPTVLVKRISELEKEKKTLEKAVAEESKTVVQLDVPHVVYWLSKFKEGDIKDFAFRQQLIDLLVNSVTVWDEDGGKTKITIAYNLSGQNEKTYHLEKGDTSCLDINSNGSVLRYYLNSYVLYHTITL